MCVGFLTHCVIEVSYCSCASRLASNKINKKIKYRRGNRFVRLWYEMANLDHIFGVKLQITVKLMCY